METQQKINLRIVEEFSKEAIEFAYPMQTLSLKKDENGSGDKSAAE